MRWMVPVLVLLCAMQRPTMAGPGEDASDGEPTPDAALYSACIASDRAGGPGKATRELVGRFLTEKAFARSQYYADVVFLAGRLAERVFDSEAAVKRYLEAVRLANKRPDSWLGGQTPKQRAADALFRAAQLRMLDEKYKGRDGALALSKKHLRVETDRAKRDESAWTIAEIYRRQNNLKRMSTAYDKWRKDFGGDEGNEQRYVESYYVVAKAAERAGKKKLADKARTQTIEAYATVGAKRGSRAAAMAAELALAQAEAYYAAEFEPYRFKWPTSWKKPGAVSKALSALDERADTAKAKFRLVASYGTSTHSRVARVRIGDTEFAYAEKLISSKLPAPLMSSGRYTTFHDRLEDLLAPKFNAALTRWHEAAEDGKARGEWGDDSSRLAQQRLHDYDNPDDHPVQHRDLLGTAAASE